MAENVPGTDIPGEVLARLDATPKEQQAEESVRIALEILEELRGMEGIAGVHLMGVRNEEGIVRVIEEAGLLPRPEVALPV